MVSILGDAAAAGGCVNRVEEAFEQFLRGAVAELLARPSIQLVSSGKDVLWGEGFNGYALGNESPERVLTCHSDTSRPVDLGVQDLPVLHPSNTYKKQKEKKHTEIQSVCPSDETGQEDQQALEQIWEHCELEYLKPEERLLFSDAISWMFYAKRCGWGHAAIRRWSCNRGE